MRRGQRGCGPVRPLIKIHSHIDAMLLGDVGDVLIWGIFSETAKLFDKILAPVIRDFGLGDATKKSVELAIQFLKFLHSVFDLFIIALPVPIKCLWLIF